MASSSFIQIQSGVPFLVSVSGLSPFYDVNLSGTGATLYTLPSGQTFIPGNNELQVFVDGIAQEVGVDYTETGTTQITFTRIIRTTELIRIRR